MKCVIFGFGRVGWGDGRQMMKGSYRSPVSANFAKQCYFNILNTFAIDICYLTLFKHLSAEGFYITK